MIPGVHRARVLTLTAILAVGAGVLSAVRPEALLLFGAVTGCAVLVALPSLRMPFVVFFGMAILGPPEFGPPKVAYFLGVAVAVAAAIGTIAIRSSSLTSEARHLLQFTAIGVCLLGIVLTYRLASGADPVAVGRDFAPYVLLASAPILALDASATGSSERRLTWLAGIGLAVGTLLFGLAWAARRGLVEDLGSATAFAGLAMPIALLIVAAINVGEGTRAHRVIWAFLGATAVAVMAASGTRSFVLAIPAVVVAVVAASPGLWSRARRLPVAVVAFAIPLVLLVQVMPEAVIDGLLERWALLSAAIGDLPGDVSLAGRLEQTDVTWRIFLSNPLFGSQLGIGTGYADGSDSYVGDTPFTFIAGFGLLGGLAAGALMIGWLATVVHRQPPSPIAWARPAMIGILIAAATYSLIVPIVGDKGLGYAIILVGSPLLASLRLRAVDQARAGARSSSPADLSTAGGQDWRRGPQGLRTRARPGTERSRDATT